MKGQLEEFLASGAEDFWLIQPEVHLDGDWDDFHRTFERCDADLLATEVRTREEDPNWNWWSTLMQGDQPVAETETGVAALLPIVRLSRRAAEAIMTGLEEGWTGHPEALLPTLVSRAGLKIEEIGGEGSFTPEDRKRLWYDKLTWRWQGPVGYVPGMLHFPVPASSRELAPGRVSPATGAMRMLYVSPVGAAAGDLLPEVLGVFRDAGADCLLLQYDQAELVVPEEVRVIRDRGYKWQLALRHLHPDTLAEYDYIFFWDDDIGTAGFDPARFVRIMQANRLEMAQPAIESPHGLSHAITRRRASPPWRAMEGGARRAVVGRLTNFVEVMVPVFTRRAWREFHAYLDEGNQSGWGYDYIPLGQKGIVDALPVIHTRAVQSINQRSEQDLANLLNSQGLFRHGHVEHGWLFE